MLGWSKTNFMAVLAQTIGRCFFGFITLDLVEETYLNVVFIVIMMFATIEAIRYPFYMLKQFNLDKTTVGLIYSHLRYNSFIPIYPVGAVFEVITGLQSIRTVRSMEKKPYSIEMPNTFNVAIDFEYVLYSTTIIYVLVFPQNFSYLWK